MKPWLRHTIWHLAVSVGTYFIIYLELTRIVAPKHGVVRTVNGFAVYRFCQYDFHIIEKPGAHSLHHGKWARVDDFSLLFFLPLMKLEEELFHRYYSASLYFLVSISGVGEGKFSDSPYWIKLENSGGSALNSEVASPQTIDKVGASTFSTHIDLG